MNTKIITEDLFQNTNLFRMYIDESGNHHYSESNELKSRYLSLTGVVLNSLENAQKLTPYLRELKMVVCTDVDELPVLHQEEIWNKQGIWGKLRNKDINIEFGNKFLQILKEVEFTVFCVVLDKKEHLEKYGNSAMHPYHYALNVILEQYYLFLKKSRGTGDVYIESRGKKEDGLLQASYENFWHHGTSFINSDSIQSHISSKNIKIKEKVKAIAGLELADLLAMPTKLDVLHTCRNDLMPTLDQNYNLKIINIISQKYFQKDQKCNGYGKKFI